MKETNELLTYFKGDDLASSVWEGKYAQQGEITPDDMHRRMAKEFARADTKYKESPTGNIKNEKLSLYGKNRLQSTEESIYSLFKDFKYIAPQGSVMSQLGAKSIGSLSNCFVIGHPEDSYGGIFQKDEEMAQLMKRRGGVGIDISTLRPSGTATTNAAKSSTGAVSFMNRFSNTTREVAQNGRRGALMISIDIRHPDVMDFITVKSDLTKVTGANISVMVRDDFMEAVKKDEDYWLRFPCDIEYKMQEDGSMEFLTEDIDKENVQFKKVRAREYWEALNNAAHKSAEPGIIFIDKHWNYSPDGVYPQYKGVTTNPCFSGDMRILTKNGYERFDNLTKRGGNNTILTDNRIEFIGNSLNEKWTIHTENSGVTERLASNTFITSESSPVLKLSFSDGSILECTEDHHIATENGMIEAKDLGISDKILVSIPEMENNIFNKMPETNDEAVAFLMGIIAGDGTFGPQSKVNIDLWGDSRQYVSDECIKLIDMLYETEYDTIEPLVGNEWKNRKLSNYFISDIIESKKIRIGSNFLSKYLEIKYNFKKETKLVVPDFILSNAKTKIGAFYLKGIFYADGSVQGSKKSGYSVRLSQSNKSFLRDIQLICHANGIKGSIYKRRNSGEKMIKESMIKYKSQYEFITTNNCHVEFLKIGFLDKEKNQKLTDIIEGNPKEKHLNTTVNLVKSKSMGEMIVYCIKEDITKSCIVNTISARRCGEIFMQPYDACRLIALNLFSFVDDPFTDHASINFSKLYESSYEQMRLADNLIDLELEKIDIILDKINNDPEKPEVKAREITLWEKIKSVGKSGRRAGCGFTALGDMLAALNLKYDSDEALEIVSEVMSTKMKGELDCTIDLAIIRGAFDGWDNKVEYPNEGGSLEDVGANDFYTFLLGDFPEQALRMMKYGRRNVSWSTVAPTGSLSILTQTTSGLEPLFAPFYMRRKKVNPGEDNVRVDFTDENGDNWMEFPVLHPKFKEWLIVNDNFTGYSDAVKETVLDKDWLQDCFESSPWYKSIANDIDWIKRVQIQTTIQQYTTHSISSTINLPENVTVGEVSEIYEKSWDLGLKGVTVYRDGSRSGVLVTNTDKKESFESKDAPKRPKDLPVEVHTTISQGIKWNVFVGLFNGKPYEVFATPHLTNKTDFILRKVKKGLYNLVENEEVYAENIMSEMEDTQEAMTRLISTSLRHGADIRFIVEQLNKTSGDITSFSKAISRVLKKYIPDGSKSTVTCNECESENVIFEEGCNRCLDCGNSKCG